MRSGGNAGRHGQLHRKSQRRAQHREGDAGIAAGRIQQRFAGHQQSARNRVPHNVGGGPILHAASRVGPLGLGQQRDALQAAHRLLQPDQRRVADPLGKGRAQPGLRSRDRHRGNCGAPSNYARLEIARTRYPSSSQIGFTLMARKIRQALPFRTCSTPCAHIPSMSTPAGVADGMRFPKEACRGPGAGQNRRQVGKRRRPPGRHSRCLRPGRDRAPRRPRLPEIHPDCPIMSCLPPRPSSTPSTTSPKN